MLRHLSLWLAAIAASALPVSARAPFELGVGRAAVSPHGGAVRPAGSVRGWLIHTADPEYLDRVLEAAPRYGVNHLDLSHDVVMNASEFESKPELAQSVEGAARRAAGAGIKAYVWAHELDTRDKDPDLDPASPAGKAFWEARREAYRRVLRACPSLAGVVLMFGSSPTEVWDIPGRDAFWKGLSMPARVRYVTELVREVVVGEFGKQLVVRDFNHGPKQLQWLVEGLRDCPGITVYSKAEPQDFQPFYPHSPSIGAYGSTPQLLEIDLNGEYWGQSLIPVSLVGYLRYRIAHAASKGVAGAVGRIDTYRNRALGTPSEINLYAFRRLLEEPSLDEQRIYDDWLRERYRLAPGSEPARRLQSILERSFEMAKRVYYTQGFWTWKSQSSLPRNAKQIDGCIVGKSTALWDPAAAETERRLRRPAAADVRAILAEKDDGVALADANLRDMAPLAGRIAPSDYADWTRRLRLAADLARVYRAIASGYWRVKLREAHPEAPEAALTAIRTALGELEEWAERLPASHAWCEPLAEEAPRLREFAADLRASLSRGPSASARSLHPEMAAAR